METINALLLEYQQHTYLIPANQLVSLVRPKDVIVQGEELKAVYQGNEVVIRHSLDKSIYCAILHVGNREKIIVPLSKTPKPISITAQQLSWHEQAKKLVVVAHPDYPYTIAEIL